MLNLDNRKIVLKIFQETDTQQNRKKIDSESS